MLQPKLLPKAWAKSGLRNEIPDSRNSGLAQGAATYEEGFPSITMTPIPQGGKAPSGRDMNGILHEITSHIVHQNKGGNYLFNAEFAQKIGGYDKGAVLISDDFTTFYVSLIAKNKTNFNQTKDAAKWSVIATTNLAHWITPLDLTEVSTSTQNKSGHTHKLPIASKTNKGITRLNSNTNSISEVEAATPKAVKDAYDLANAAIPNSKKSDKTDSDSSDTIATSRAVKIISDKIDNIKVGGRNLLLNSAVAYSGNGYSTRYELTEAPTFGEDVVITLWGELGADRIGIGVYNTQGHSEITRLVKIADGVYQGKGRWVKPMSGSQEVTPNNTHLNVYFYPRTGTSTNTISKIKLERGTLGTDWSAAPEDKVSMTGNETIRGVKTFNQSLEMNYRSVIRRNSGITYNPYHLLIDDAIDLANSLDRYKTIGELQFAAGETGRADGRVKALLRAGVDVDKHGYLELGAYGNDYIFRYGIKAFGSTGNVSIGKTTDNGNARLQVNGNIEATPPANNANNRLLPTTSWVRTNAANLVDARTAYLGGSVAMQDCKPGQLPQGAFFGVASKNLAGTAQNGFTFLSKPWYDNSGHFASVRFGVFGNKFYYQSAKNANEWNTALELATVPYVDGRFNQLIGAAPQALDTLQELAQALKNNSNVLNLYMLKADKSDAVNLDNSNKYATSKAVKLANDNANGRLSKTGGTLTGVLDINIGDYSFINQWNTAGKQARSEVVPDNFNYFYKTSYRSNNGNTEEHSAHFRKSGVGKYVAYEDWVEQRLAAQHSTHRRQNSHPQGSRTAFNVRGSVHIFPGGQIVQKFVLENIKPAWFDKEGGHQSGEAHYYIPVGLWTAMPHDVVKVTAFTTKAQDNQQSYYGEAAEWVVAWEEARQNGNKNTVGIFASRFRGGNDETINLVVYVEGY